MTLSPSCAASHETIRSLMPRPSARPADAFLERYARGYRELFSILRVPAPLRERHFSSYARVRTVMPIIYRSRSMTRLSRRVSRHARRTAMILFSGCDLLPTLARGRGDIYLIKTPMSLRPSDYSIIFSLCRSATTSIFRHFTPFYAARALDIATRCSLVNMMSVT